MLRASSSRIWNSKTPACSSRLLAGKAESTVSEQARDLIAAQFSGNPGADKSAHPGSGERGRKLESFTDVENVYADSIFGGRIAGAIRFAFDHRVRHGRPFRKEYSECSIYRAEFGIGADADRVLDPPSADRDRVKRSFSCDVFIEWSFVRATSTHVEMMNENIAVNDYIETRVPSFFCG
jgi:hypothetical protein